MGVRMLNRYIREYSPKSFTKIPLSNLRGKKIAIDISIFIYQFIGDDKLLENMYNMIMLFRNNYIIPIFVFDGVPPEEKMCVLYERDSLKKESKKKCEQLEEELSQTNNISEINEIKAKLHQEKKKCIRISNKNIRDIKELISIMGVIYLEATGEADELCCYLVKKKMAWACMSEDMDFFVYGCNRVLRSFDLEQKTTVLYNTQNILSDLDMSHDEFKNVCLLAGTDYSNKKVNIFTAMNYFYKFKRRCKNNLSFYNWLLKSNIIYEDEINELYKTSSLFSLNNYEGMINTQYVNKRINKNELLAFMEKHNLKNLLTLYNGKY